MESNIVAVVVSFLREGFYDENPGQSVLQCVTELAKHGTLRQQILDSKLMVSALLTPLTRYKLRQYAFKSIMDLSMHDDLRQQMQRDQYMVDTLNRIERDIPEIAAGISHRWWMDTSHGEVEVGSDHAGVDQIV